MNKELLKRINDLINIDNFEEAEIIFEKLIEADNFNTEIRLRLAKLLLVPPLVDDIKSEKNINEVLKYDNNNFEAILLLCCINYFMRGGIDDEIFNKLLSINTKDNEKLSMIEYIKSWHYDLIKDDKMYEQSLLKSIELFPGHVWNHEKLGFFYIKLGRKKEAKELFRIALKNVNHIYTKENENKYYDYTDVEMYFNQLVKGTHITYVLYEGLQEKILHC